ncbi:unnamed protein product, partial [Amoebophrya sp. A25]
PFSSWLQNATDLSTRQLCVFLGATLTAVGLILLAFWAFLWVRKLFVRRRALSFATNDDEQETTSTRGLTELGV